MHALTSGGALVVVALFVTVGCGPVESAPPDEVITHPDAPPIAPFTECTVIVTRTPAVSAEHRTPCSVIEYPSHPPSSGAHYSSWTAFRAYDAPVPWGFLVHSLEHGAVVLAHRCEGACPEITDAFATLATEQEMDPACRVEDSPSRLVQVPDPELEWPIALVAWEHVYRATCVDLPSMRAFIADHYDRAPESLCAPGVDLEAMGWCD